MDIKPKNLLKRVLKFARDELERRAVPHEADVREEHAQPETSVVEAARDGDEELPSVEAQRSVELPARQTETAPHADAAKVSGLDVQRAAAGGHLTLRWSVTKAEVARAQTQLSGNPVLCVRLVSFSKGRDAVLREVQDRPGVDLVGDCEIGEPQARAVVSLGLRAGERFVSIAHHVL